MSKLLDNAELESELAKLPVEWAVVGGTELTRVYRFDGFKDGLAFVNKVGRLAEKNNHHPEVALSWDKVVVTLSTHSEGGLTLKDFKFAAEL